MNKIVSSDPDLANGASFSADRKYRYHLWRSLGRGAGTVTFIMLNPSTADDVKDDPTIRRCLGFAKGWGYQRMDVVNLFAFRTPYPSVLKRASYIEAVGWGNDDVIQKVASEASLVIAAWGAHGSLHQRDDDVVAMLVSTGKLHYLRFTKAKQPCHPLYLPRTLKPIPWGKSV